MENDLKYCHVLCVIVKATRRQRKSLLFHFLNIRVLYFIYENTFFVIWIFFSISFMKNHNQFKCIFALETNSAFFFLFFIDNDWVWEVYFTRNSRYLIVFHWLEEEWTCFPQFQRTNDFFLIEINFFVYFV